MPSLLKRNNGTWEAAGGNLPPAVRSSSVTAVVALSCAADTTTPTTFTVTGAEVSDYVLANVTTALPAGISVAQAFVSADDTVTVVFGNHTAAPVAVTCDVHAIVFRQFF